MGIEKKQSKAKQFISGGSPWGLRVPGNIDVLNRPVVQNPDGSYSTVRSMSFGTEDGEVLIPTISPDGKLLSNEQAIDLYNQTGKHLGIFDTPESADRYAKYLHNQQQEYYGLK